MFPAFQTHNLSKILFTLSDKITFLLHLQFNKNRVPIKHKKCLVVAQMSKGEQVSQTGQQHDPCAQ